MAALTGLHRNQLLSSSVASCVATAEAKGWFHKIISAYADEPYQEYRIKERSDFTDQVSTTFAKILHKTDQKSRFRRQARETGPEALFSQKRFGCQLNIRWQVLQFLERKHRPIHADITATNIAAATYANAALHALFKSGNNVFGSKAELFQRL